MASDIVLGDDGTLGIVGSIVTFKRPAIPGPTFTFTLPVQITGPIQFRDTVLVGVHKPKPTTGTGLATTGGADLADVGMSPSWTPDVLAAASEQLALGALAGGIDATGVLGATRVFEQLREMQPPYDLLKLLTLLRAAVLDLHGRMGGP